MTLAPILMTSISENLETVELALSQAAQDAGRDRQDITLVAVSKTHDGETIKSAIAAGQRVFGENRVQEAANKWPDLKSAFEGIALHLIGPLQTNKVKDAVALFDVIESVDREKLARRLASEMEAQGKSLPIFVQVNTGEEPQKSGVFPKDVTDFVSFCRDELGLNVIGLMAIPPVDEEPALHFALLKKLAKAAGLDALSMGMSSDFEVAIAFGATHVRVGTAIFGARMK